MAKRPAGLAALTGAFAAAELTRDDLARFERPVLYVLGAQSNPDLYESIAQRLSGVFGDFTLEVFADRHHFDPPHRAEPERVAGLLRAFWERAGHADA